MKELPDYRNFVKEYHVQLWNLFDKYKDKSPLWQGIEGRIKECERVFGDADLKPQIMLYGDYNVGKSTLMNALMGRKVAAVGDVPTTAAASVFEWNGYRFLDTPGINAPVEHEQVTNAEIDRCQVVICVISTGGSFENAYIYEKMRELAKKGKKLLVVLNDKAGDPEANEIIKQRVWDNFRKLDVGQVEARRFLTILVNAQDALVGRLEGDERLVVSSGIHRLESKILSEIREVDGFKVLRDLLNTLLSTTDPLVAELAKSHGDVDGKLADEARRISEEYYEFVKNEQGMVKQECAGLAVAIFAAIGSSGNARNANAQSLGDCVNGVLADYQNRVNERLNLDVEAMKVRLSSLIEESARDIGALSKLSADVGQLSEIVESLQALYGKASGTDEMESKTAGNSNSRNGSSSGGMADAALTLELQKLVTVLPIPPQFKIPAQIIAAIAIPLVRALFGGSDEEERNQRVEAEIEAKRRAQEQRAEEEKRRRQELREWCDASADQAVSKLQSDTAKRIEDCLKLFVDKVCEAYRGKKAERAVLLADLATYEEIKENIQNTMEDLSKK